MSMFTSPSNDNDDDDDDDDDAYDDDADDDTSGSHQKGFNTFPYYLWLATEKFSSKFITCNSNRHQTSRGKTANTFF